TMPARKIPPAPRTRCKAPGAQAGGAFFAPGFFAQAKKGGSRRHGAKALDLDVGERAAGQDPPYEAAVAAEGQGQLAALAPSSGASRHLLPHAGEGLFGGSLPHAGEGLFGGSLPQAGEGLFGGSLPQAGKGLFGGSPAGGRRARDWWLGQDSVSPTPRPPPAG